MSEYNNGSENRTEEFKNKPLNFSDILEERSGKLFDKEYIVPGEIEVDNLSNDFHYIQNIKVQPFQNGTEVINLVQNNYINITLGGENLYERHNNNVKLCQDYNDYVTYDIDFPTSILFKHHKQKMTLKTGGIIGKLYKIVVRGLKLDNIEEISDSNMMIEYNHDPKYYQKDKFVFRSMCGMGGISSTGYPNWYKQDYEQLHENSIEYRYNSNTENHLSQYDNAITEITLENPNTGLKYDLIKIDAVMTLGELLEILVSNEKLLVNNNYKYKSENDFYSDYIVGGLIKNTLKFQYIDNISGNDISLTYNINRFGDIVYSLNILNKVSALFGDSIKIELLEGQNVFMTKEIEVSKINETINFDKMSIILRNQYNLTKLRITCNQKYFDYFDNLVVYIGYGVAESKLRKNIAQAEKFDLNAI